MPSNRQAIRSRVRFYPLSRRLAAKRREPAEGKLRQSWEASSPFFERSPGFLSLFPLRIGEDIPRPTFSSFKATNTAFIATLMVVREERREV